MSTTRLRLGELIQFNFKLNKTFKDLNIFVLTIGILLSSITLCQSAPIQVLIRERRNVSSDVGAMVSLIIVFCFFYQIN